MVYWQVAQELCPGKCAVGSRGINQPGLATLSDNFRVASGRSGGGRQPIGSPGSRALSNATRRPGRQSSPQLAACHRIVGKD